MPVSRFLIPLVSTVWIFSVMGGMGMHVLAEQPTEVQAVRRQFSTLEEVTAVQVQEEGSTVRFLPGNLIDNRQTINIHALDNCLLHLHSIITIVTGIHHLLLLFYLITNKIDSFRNQWL